MRGLICLKKGEILWTVGRYISRRFQVKFRDHVKTTHFP
jgi:hypothetical protein